MFTENEIEVVHFEHADQVEEVKQFLSRFQLSYEQDVEYTITVRQDGELVGTGSIAGEVLRNIAVDEQHQGSGLLSCIVTELIKEQVRRNRWHYFVFTKPCRTELFQGLGFTEIARFDPYVSLLETGIGSVASYCERVHEQVAHLKPERAAIVVNCNPFTKGHRALIEQASKENEAVIVFVVSEDCSIFPFVDRLKLVKEGVADLPNVAVVPGEKYMISATTFPAYFTREEDKVYVQTRLDLTLFATQIAPRLGITARYAGEEPFCQVTNSYNQAMLEILPAHGIHINIIDRAQIDGEVISASKVRSMMQNGVWNEIKKVVPENTYQYLVSADAKDVVEKVLVSTSRH